MSDGSSVATHRAWAKRALRRKKLEPVGVNAHGGGRQLFGDGAARGPHKVVPHPVGKDAGAVAPTREIRQV